MTSFSEHLSVFLKSPLQEIERKRENWNTTLEVSLQELNDPKYDQTGQALVFVFLRFFLLQVRLVMGLFLFLMSTTVLRGALESITYLPLAVVLFFCSFVCLVSPFTRTAFKPWRALFLNFHFKSFTLKFLLQLAFFCMAFRTAYYMGGIVWDFFVKGIGE